MKRFFLFLCLALAVSCGDSLSFPKWYCRNTDYPAFDVRDSLFSSSDSTSSDEPVKPRDNNIYLLTLEYPQGYDFLTDSLKGVVSGCYLKVYKNFALHRSIEVSDSNEVDSAEDNNYLIGGHLYSVYKGRENTLIKLDGESLFTLPAGHRVSGLIVIEGSVYTLSFSQGQWLLSRDGVPLRIGSGEIFHNLYDDCGDPCFAWKDGRDVYIYYNGKYERVEIGGNSVDDV
ncbi:MAG: hypothetical protein HUJ95_07020, partial [Bacteroidales bacterium]|nr:hypothetical protein [Bacteroidales bacterium]